MDRWPDIPPPPDPNVIFEQFRLDLPPTQGLINPGEQLSNNATDLGQNKNQQAKQQGQFMSQNWQQQDFTTGSGYQYPQERSTFQQMQHFGPPTNLNNAGQLSSYDMFGQQTLNSRNYGFQQSELSGMTGQCSFNLQNQPDKPSFDSLNNSVPNSGLSQYQNLQYTPEENQCSTSVEDFELPYQTQSANTGSFAGVPSQYHTFTDDPVDSSRVNVDNENVAEKSDGNQWYDPLQASGDDMSISDYSDQEREDHTTMPTVIDYQHGKVSIVPEYGSEMSMGPQFQKDVHKAKIVDQHGQADNDIEYEADMNNPLHFQKEEHEPKTVEDFYTKAKMLLPLGKDHQAETKSNKQLQKVKQTDNESPEKTNELKLVTENVIKELAASVNLLSKLQEAKKVHVPEVEKVTCTDKSAGEWTKEKDKPREVKKEVVEKQHAVTEVHSEITDDSDGDPEHVQAQIFLGNLAPSTTLGEIRRLLKGYEVQVWQAYLPDKVDNVCAFVKMSTLKEAKCFILESDDTMLRGKQLDIRFAAAQDFDDYKVGKPPRSSAQKQKPEKQTPGPMKKPVVEEQEEIQQPDNFLPWSISELETLQGQGQEDTTPSGAKGTSEVAGCSEPTRSKEVRDGSVFWEAIRAECSQAALVGLKYIVEYVSSNKSCYLCTLCRVKFMDTSVVNHLVGLQHRMKFLKETIPSLYQDLVIIGRQHGQEQLEIECAHYVARNVPKGETINVVQCDKKLPAEDAVDLDLESIQNESLRELEARKSRLASKLEGDMKISPTIGSRIDEFYKQFQEKSPINKYIIGLKYVTEVLKRKKGETIYVCGLCHCVNFNAHIFGHVTGYKHRMKFFEVCKPEVHKIIKDANLTGLKELKSVCLRAAQAIEESDGLSQVLTITEAQKILLEARYGPMIQYRPPKSKQTEVLVVAPKLEGKRGPSTPGPFPVVSLETDIFKMKVTGEMLQKLGLIQAAQPVEYKESLDQDVHLYKYLQENSLMDSPLPGLGHIYEIQDLPGAGFEKRHLYFCSLCDQVSGNRALAKSHIRSLNHGIKYFTKVLPELTQKLGLLDQATKQEVIQFRAMEYHRDHGNESLWVVAVRCNEPTTTPVTGQPSTPQQTPGSTPSTRKEEANKTVAMVDEPIRPRVFDIIRRNSSISSKPAVGLHLMTEYQNAVNQAEKPRFDCRLCNVKLTCDSVYSHLIGDRHVTTYMEKHHNILSDAVKERPERLDMYGRWLDASGPRKVTVVQISGYNARQEPLYTYPKHIEDTEYVSPYAGMYTLKYIETTTDAINSIQPKPRKNSGTDGKQLTQAISKDQGRTRNEEDDWKIIYRDVEERRRNKSIVQCARMSRFQKLYMDTTKTEAFIGLAQVNEFQQPDFTVDPWYMCYICKIKVTWPDILQHVTSQDHRLLYMMKNYQYIYKLATGYDPEKKSVAEYAMQIQNTEGAMKKTISVFLELKTDEEALKCAMKTSETRKHRSPGSYGGSSRNQERTRTNRKSRSRSHGRERRRSRERRSRSHSRDRRRPRGSGHGRSKESRLSSSGSKRRSNSKEQRRYKELGQSSSGSVRGSHRPSSHESTAGSSVGQKSRATPDTTSMVGNEAKTVKKTVEAGKEGNKIPVRDGGLQTSGTLEDSAGLQKYSTQKGNEWKDSENTKKDMVKTVKSGYDLEKNDGIAMDRDLKIELENELARLAEEDDEDFSDGIEDDGIHINVNNEDLLPSTGENSDGIAKDKMVEMNTYVKGHGDRKGDTRSEEESQVRKDYGLRQDIHTKDDTNLQKGSPIVSRMSPKYYSKDNRMKEKDKSKEDLTKHQIIPKYGGARQQGSPTDVATRLESSHLKRPHISEVRSNIDVKSRKSRFQSGASTCTFPARDANSPQRGKITRTNSRDPYSYPRGLSRGTDSRNIPHARKSADEIHTSRLVQDIDSSARDEPYGQYRSSFSPQERPVLSKQYKSSPKAVEQISRDPSPRSRSFLTEPGCDNMSTDRQNEATGWTVHASRHTYVPGHPDVNRMRGNHQDVEPMALQPVIVPQFVSNTPVVYSQYELDGHTVQPALYPDYDKFREDCGTFGDGRYSSPHHETASTDRLLDVHRDYGFSNGARNFSPRDYDDDDIPGRYPDGDGHIHHGYQDAGGDMSSRYHDSDMDISSRNPEEDVGPGYHNSDTDISPSYPDEDIGPGFFDSDMDISTRYSDENRSPKQHHHNDDIASRYRDNNDIADTYPHDDISSRFNDHRSSQFSSTDDSYFPASKRQNINTDDTATNNASRAFSEGYKEGVDANSELSVETQPRPLPNAYRHGKILFPAAVTGKIDMMLESSINKEPLQNVVDRWCKTYPHHCPIGLQMVTEFTHHDCELPPVYMCRACDKRLRTNDRYYTMKNMFKHILSEDHCVTFMLSHYKNDYYGLERNAKNADSYFGLFKNLCNRIYKETSKDNSVYEVKTKAVIYWKKAFGMRVSYIKQKIAEQKRLSKPGVKQTESKKNQPPTNLQSIEQQTMEQQTTEKPTLSISQGIINRRKKLRAREVKLVNVESPESFDVKFVEALTKERLCKMIHVFYKRQNKPNPNVRGNWKKSERCVVYYDGKGVFARGEVLGPFRSTRSYKVYLLDYDTEIICSYKELWDVEPKYQMRWENLDICTCKLANVEPCDQLKSWPTNIAQVMTRLPSLEGSLLVVCKGPAEDGRQPVELLMEDIRDGRLSYHALSDILVKMKVARFTGGDGTINPSPIKGIVPHTPKANINTLPKGDNLSTEDQPGLSGNKILSKGDQPSLSGNTNMPKGDNLSKGDQPSLSSNKMLKGDNLSKGNQPGLSGNKNLPKFGNRVKQKGPGLQEEPKVTSTAKDPPPVGKQSEKVMYDIMDQCYNTDGKVAVTTRLNPDSGTVGKSERESTNRKKAVNEVPVCRNDKQEARKSSASKNGSSTDISHLSNTGCPSTKKDSCVVSVKTGSVQERDVSISHPGIVKTEPLDVEDATMEPIAIERVKIEPVAFGSIKTEPVTITNVRTEPIAIENIKTEPVAIESSEVDNEELSEGEQEDLENAFKEYMDELEGTADDVSDEC